VATWYSRTWPSGKVSWYTKVPVVGKWKPLLLKGVKTEPQAKKLALELEKERERAGNGLQPGAPCILQLADGTPVTNFAELCAWAFEIKFSKGPGAQPDGSRLKQHAGDREKGTCTWLGALPVRQVTGPLLAKYFAEIEKTHTVRGKPPAPRSVNRLRAQFATVFELAKEHGGWFGDNPVHATKAREELDAGHDILEAHEIAPTLAACDPYWRGCLAVGILAGLRKGELFGLQKRDVDLAGRVMRVRRSHGRETTKGGKHAGVPIHEALVPYIEEWLRTPGPWLFPNHAGKQRSHQVDLPRILRTAMARAGFVDHWEFKCRRKGCGFGDEQASESKRDCPQCGFRLWATPRARSIRWHEGTRHTMASHAIMSGASIASVQAILRHADPRLTINTYGHLSAGFLGSEVNRVQVPGLATPAHAEQHLAKSGEMVEPTPAPMHTGAGARGAWVVRTASRAHQAANGETMNQHENSPGSEWSRGDLNPGPMHCEGKGGLLPVVPPLRTASQTVGIPHPEQGADSTPLPPVPQRPAGRGAPMVRGGRSTHHESECASAGCSGRTTEHGSAPLAGEMLTIQQVADRLAVGRTWVRRRIESGDLPAVKAHPQAPRLVPAAALADYLARFPGIVLAEPPAPPVAAPAASRKGAA
jgi:excisionase family DNA binding protein